jgi:hypothetical protein
MIIALVIAVACYIAYRRRYVVKTNRKLSVILVESMTGKSGNTSELNPESKERVKYDEDQVDHEHLMKKKLASRLDFAKLKVVLIAYQLLVQNQASLTPSKYPSMSYSLLNFASFLNFDLGNLIPTGCSKPLDAARKMFVSTIIPISIVAGLAVAYVYKWIKIQRLIVVNENERIEKIIATQYQFAFVILMLIFCVVPQVSVNIFSTFNCIDIDPYNEDVSNIASAHYVMRNDYTVDCNSSYYQGWRIWAIVMTIVYPIGSIVLIGSSLFRYRHLISSRKELTILKNRGHIVYRKHKDYFDRQPFYELLSSSFIQYNPMYWFWGRRHLRKL